MKHLLYLLPLLPLLVALLTALCLIFRAHLIMLWRWLRFHKLYRECLDTFNDYGIDPDRYYTTNDNVWAWHCHHTTLAEPIIDTVKDRADYILYNKPYDEVATRLKLFRPASYYIKSMQLAEQYHSRHCYSNCPWNGRTIIPGHIFHSVY